MSPLDGPRRELRRVLHHGTPYWARPDGNELVLADGRRVAERDVAHLAPCEPTKIICVHLNYASRAVEFEAAVRAAEPPTYFMKPTTSLNGHGGELVRPDGCRYLNYEGELAVVIGRVTRNIAREDAWAHVMGFAPANDAGLHDLRMTDAGSMLRTKGADGLCPIGPGLVSGVDVRRSTLRTFCNGEMVQDAGVDDLLYGVDYLIADLARYITLLPGDVILTGTPANSRPLKPGDLVEVEITGIGRLANRVTAGPSPLASEGAQPQDSTGVRTVALGSDSRVVSRT